MISAKLNGKDLILVEVPKGAKHGTNFGFYSLEKTEKQVNRIKLRFDNPRGGGGVSKAFTLPKDKRVKFLTTSDSITEEQARELAKDNGAGCYIDFVNQKPDNKYTLLSALESFQSWLRSIGCKQGTNYAILEKL